MVQNILPDVAGICALLIVLQYTFTPPRKKNVFNFHRYNCPPKAGSDFELGKEPLSSGHFRTSGQVVAASN